MGSLPRRPRLITGCIRAEAWLLSSGGHRHGHDHGHSDHDDHDDHHGHDDEHRVSTAMGALVLSVFETNHPPVFRVRADSALAPGAVDIETLRPDGSRQTFSMADRVGYLQSVEVIPEPHEFVANVLVGSTSTPVAFEEHGHDAHGLAHRDNNMRAALVHVMADAAVSVLVIVGLLLARALGWL